MGRKSTKGSSTPGRQKGSNCQKSQLKNLHSKDSRLYRTNPFLYAKAAQAVNKEKGNMINGSPWVNELLNQ
jgi:hypothetical protein